MRKKRKQLSRYVKRGREGEEKGRERGEGREGRGREAEGRGSGEEGELRRREEASRGKLCCYSTLLFVLVYVVGV